MFYDEMQEKLEKTCRIPLEVVEISNFESSRHNIWIQAKRDTKKEWL
jgi:hypothetical protein